MARPRAPQPVKLLVGLLSGDDDLLRRSRQLLTRDFGEVDVESAVWPFDQTDYYADEMGTDLRRQFLAFEMLVAPDRLAEIKLRTNAHEALIAEQCLLPDIPRPVNIDPGYLELNRLVLATTKDRAHRIYLGRGIYAEITLLHEQGAWRTLPWTYADYATPEYHAYFDAVRGRLVQQRRSPAGPAP